MISERTFENIARLTHKPNGFWHVSFSCQRTGFLSGRKATADSNSVTSHSNLSRRNGTRKKLIHKRIPGGQHYIFFSRNRTLLRLCGFRFRCDATVLQFLFGGRHSTGGHLTANTSTRAAAGVGDILVVEIKATMSVAWRSYLHVDISRQEGIAPCGFASFLI